MLRSETIAVESGSCGSRELLADLAGCRVLVASLLRRKVGPLLRELPKKRFWVMKRVA